MHSAIESLQGQPFFVRRWGDPSLPRLLLLHGFPEYGGAWQEVAHHLSQDFHCIAPDQRGYGQSWTPEGVENYAAGKLIGDMVALIGADTGPVTVFGHDWGAAIAYGLAMFHPQLVDRLIIANGVHPGPFQRALAQGGAQTEASQYIHWLRQPGVEAELRANGFEKLQNLFATHMDMSWLSGARLQDYKTEWSRPGRLQAMVNWYRASPLQVAKPGQPIALPALPLERLKVPQPHLLLWGDGDTALLPETTLGLEDFAPQLTRITIPGCDHWLHHQKPKDLAEAILNWHP
ncbi:alpha/beta fold hydrolase [Pseudophaeobacter arcticus]|uniref:alpha/beta fold hydrolase n=1 Tax=Pseudophaeobacter arcticus TaxID=385492 RepID=UPI002491FFAF|nr:alpha/beta hydrolase [Pseudophaeobacter arcticus]